MYISNHTKYNRTNVPFVYIVHLLLCIVLMYDDGVRFVQIRDFIITTLYVIIITGDLTARNKYINTQIKPLDSTLC